MRITFVAIGSEQLAISLLANIAKQHGHEVNLAFCAALFHDRFNLEIPWLNKYFDDTENTIATIKEQEPELLVFSALTATYQWSLEVARRSKELLPNVKTVFGGVHVSAVPDRVLPREEVDFVVVGEGEEAFVEIIQAVESKEYPELIGNTNYKRDDGEIVVGPKKAFEQNLDRLPPFTKELFEPFVHVADHYITMASRGCPYRCTFCFNNFFAELPEAKNKGRYVRQRSVDHVLMEMHYIKNRYKNLRWIDFEDDVFTSNKEWLKEFLPRYKKEIGLPFECLTHPRHMDEEIAQLLMDSGCRWVQMGIQTLDDGFKGSSLRRYEKTGHVERALKAMLKVGLKVKVDQMFGLPGEPIEAQEAARVLYAEHCPVRIQTYWTCFLPGTELMTLGLEEGIITEQDAERLNEGEDFYFFRNPNNIKDPGLVKSYQGYQMLFKIYPILPRFIRRRLKEKYIRWIPAGIKNAIGVIADLLNAVVHLNPTFYAYAKYYMFHLYAISRRKLGLKPVSVTKIKDNTPFDFNHLNKFKLKEELVNP